MYVDYKLVYAVQVFATTLAVSHLVYIMINIIAKATDAFILSENA